MANFVELMLAALQFQAEGMLELSDILFLMPVRVRWRFHRVPLRERQWFSTNWAEKYRDRQQFHRTLQYLKRQGLVVEGGKKRRMKWALTKAGNKQLKKYQQLRADPFSRAHTNFGKSKGSGITIVTFDIPEKERKKRSWLRICLIEMNFMMLQKSVWMVKGAVPDEFIHALRDRALLNYVHILGVTQQGTVQTI